MKKIILLLGVVLTFGLVLNCSPVKIQNPHIQREWMLVSFDHFTKEQLIKSRAGINLTAPKEEGEIRGGAFMGCNKMFFVAEFKDNGKVKISGIGGTMMACPDMELESSFSKSFKAMTKYSVDGHFLKLSDKNGNIMKFIASDWD